MALEFDGTMIGQALTNLIKNAGEATEGLIERMGGEVDMMGVNMRLFDPLQLSGLKLSFPDGRGWSGEGPWGFVRDAAVMP